MRRYAVVLLLSASLHPSTRPPEAAEPAIESLVRDLRSSDAAARARARQLLPRRGFHAAAAVFPHLTDPDPATAKAVFDILFEVANQSCAPGREVEAGRMAEMLMPLVGPDRTERERVLGLRLLERTVPPGYDLSPIAAMLAEGGVLRDKARAALERIGTPAAAAALRNALQSSEPEFQCAILNSLGTMEDSESLDDILNWTRSRSPDVRAAAVRALAWTGEPNYLPAAQEVVSTAAGENRADALDAMLRLLNAMEARTAERDLVRGAYLELLEKEEGSFRDAALAGLGRVGDADCVPAILAAMEEADPRTELNALAALRSLPDPAATGALGERYTEIPERFRPAVVEALGDRRDAAALPVLEAAVISDQPGLRFAALRALGAAGCVEGIPALVNAAGHGSDPEKDTARAAILTLAENLQRTGDTEGAGRAFVAAFEVAATEPERVAALHGIAACPAPEAYHAVMEVSPEGDLREPVIQALVGVAETTARTGANQKALAAIEKAGTLGPDGETLARMANVLHAMGLHVDAASMLGIVSQWWLLGPFELGEGEEGWKSDLIGEPDVRLDEAVAAGGKRFHWKPAVSTDIIGRLDLRKEIADRDLCVGYAYAEVVVDRETDAELRLGVDDSEKVWVNGELVFELFAPRGLTPDADRIPIRLRAGSNPILLKIWQKNMGWEFCARITVPDGTPLRFRQQKP